MQVIHDKLGISIASLHNNFHHFSSLNWNVWATGFLAFFRHIVTSIEKPRIDLTLEKYTSILFVRVHPDKSGQSISQQTNTKRKHKSNNSPFIPRTLKFDPKTSLTGCHSASPIIIECSRPNRCDALEKKTQHIRYLPKPILGQSKTGTDIFNHRFCYFPFQFIFLLAHSALNTGSNAIRIWFSARKSCYVPLLSDFTFKQQCKHRYSSNSGLHNFFSPGIKAIVLGPMCTCYFTSPASRSISNWFFQQTSPLLNGFVTSN